jgi:hypothetical protein
MTLSVLSNSPKTPHENASPRFMKFRRYIIILAVGLLAVVLAANLASFVYLRHERTHDRTVDAERIVQAVRAFALDHTSRGVPLPASVSLTELISHGFLGAEDVKPFAHTDVRILLTADESRPSRILIEARLPDGTRIAGLADGSVMGLPK